MGLQIDLLHIRIERRSGNFVYRRRIPQTVRPILDGRREFTRVIGKTQAEALANYAEVHAFAESLIRGHRRLRALPDLRPCQAFAAVPPPLPQETSPPGPPACVDRQVSYSAVFRAFRYLRLIPVPGPVLNSRSHPHIHTHTRECV